MFKVGLMMLLRWQLFEGTALQSRENTGQGFAQTRSPGPTQPVSGILTLEMYSLGLLF